MKITIYRYPHPLEVGKWLYTGQSVNLTARDKQHRKGKEGFGRRFKKMFPGVELSKPDFREIEVADHLEANFEETVAIFRNHTWHGQGGMNLTLPGSDDYRNLGVLSGRESVRTGRIHKLLKKNAETGHLQSLILQNIQTGHIRRLGKGGSGGRAAAQSGQLASLRTPEHQRYAGGISGRNNIQSGHIFRISQLPQSLAARRKNVHIRWHVNRNIVNPSCSLCQQAKAA